MTIPLTLLPHLDFSHGFFYSIISQEEKERIHIIDNILFFHYAQLECFNLSLDRFLDKEFYERNICKLVRKWIHFTASKIVKKLLW
jgi:hypothetical protein